MINSKRTIKLIGILLLVFGVVPLALAAARTGVSAALVTTSTVGWALGCIAGGIGVVGLSLDDPRAAPLVRSAAIALGVLVVAVFLFSIRLGSERVHSTSLMAEPRETTPAAVALFCIGFALTSIALGGLSLRRQQPAGSTLAGALGVAVAVVGAGSITRFLVDSPDVRADLPTVVLAFGILPLLGFALSMSAKDQLSRSANAGNRPRVDHKLSMATGTAFGLLIVCGLFVFSVEEREARDFERFNEIGRAREALYAIESTLHSLELSARNAWESRRDFDFVTFDRRWKSLGGKLHQLSEWNGPDPQKTAAAQVISQAQGRANLLKLTINSLRPGRATYGVTSGADGIPPVSSEMGASMAAFQSELQQEVSQTESASADRRRDAMIALIVLALAIAGLLVTVHVLSQRDAQGRLRSELSLRRHNETLKGFAHTVAHDLRAPLRGIAGYAGELEIHAAQVNARGKHCITQISTAAQNLDRLIGDTLEYAQLDAETPRMTLIQLPALVTSLLQQRAAAIRQHGALVDTHFEIETVTSWERGVVQIIGNLLDNAIKYSRYAQPPRLRIETAQTPLAWRLMIYDNGIGFDMKYHDRIFGLFQRLVTRDEFEGTGAGLAIVRKITDRLGGTVCAEARPGGGATFLVELPKVSNTELG
ncbi:MAG: ATP-binding protein [Opitutus sp.]